MDEKIALDSGTLPVNNRRGISGSTLKLIAIITMLIDHTAATILDNTLYARGFDKLDQSDSQAFMDFISDNALLYSADMMMRLIGRIAFPIFCFLLVEGFLHTRNQWKYAGRLAVFALISEIPFDLAFHKTAFYLQYQNVFFTLLIGLMVLMGFRYLAIKAEHKQWLPGLAVLGAIAAGSYISYMANGFLSGFQSGLNSMGITVSLSNNNVKFVMAIMFSGIALICYLIMYRKGLQQKASAFFADLAVLVAGMYLAELLCTDYSGMGVLTIAVIYWLRKVRVRAMIGGCTVLSIMSMIEIVSFVDVLLIHFYNGKRGMNLKYIFYAFYPVHLLILYYICYVMKII